jgi:hypothetical protein
VANPEKGEVDLILFEDDPEKRKHYTLRFTAGGRREMEDFLDLDTSDIELKIFGDPTDPDRRIKAGYRLTVGLFFGATRKYHRRDFPTIHEIDELMDLIDDEADDPSAEGQKLWVALIAAYTKSSVSDIEARLMGEQPSQARQKPGEANGSSSGPKDQDKPTRKPKQKAASGGDS